MLPRIELVLVVVSLLAFSAAQAGGAPVTKRFHGQVTVEAALKGTPRAVVARTVDFASAGCGSAPIDETGAYDLTLLPDGVTACTGQLQFWLRQSGAREVPFAETASFAGPPVRRLDLHILGPMRMYGDVISARDLAGAAVVGCTPSCTTPRHIICGGGRVFGFTFAAQIAPKAPGLACPASGGPVRFAVRTEDGALYPAGAATRFASSGVARIDVVAGFPRRDTVDDFTTNQRASVAPGQVTAFTYNVRLGSTRSTMNWWVLVYGPEGTQIRSIAATDPVVNQPEHNTWVCIPRPRIPGPNADLRSARCAGFIGPPPPGLYTVFVELKAPPTTGTMVVELFNVAGTDHARERLTIDVR